MAAATNTSEQRVILEGVSWETYERLLSENQEKAGTRFAYDQGTLEIMVVSFAHEDLSRTIAMLVELVVSELELDCVAAGSTTFRRDDLAKGFEPDECFYLRQPERIRGKTEIDLRRDPAPDLVVEVDLASPSLDKLPIYWSIGVSEIWRYTKDRLVILKQGRSGYIETAKSVLLPGVSSADVNRLLDRRSALRRHLWIREVREWARTLAPQK